MTDEEAVRIVSAMAREDPEGTLRLVKKLAADDPEAMMLLKVATKAREEADRRGVPVEDIVDEWMKPAGEWGPKT